MNNLTFFLLLIRDFEFHNLYARTQCYVGSEVRKTNQSNQVEFYHIFIFYCNS